MRGSKVPTAPIARALRVPRVVSTVLPQTVDLANPIGAGYRFGYGGSGHGGQPQRWFHRDPVFLAAQQSAAPTPDPEPAGEPGFLSKEKAIAGPDFNRWLAMPPVSSAPFA